MNKQEILAVTAALNLAFRRRDDHGQRDNYFGTVEFFPRVKGDFTGAIDSFNEARHRVDIGASSGSGLRDVWRRLLACVSIGETPVPQLLVEAVKPSPKDEIEYFQSAVAERPSADCRKAAKGSTWAGC